MRITCMPCRACRCRALSWSLWGALGPPSRVSLYDGLHLSGHHLRAPAARRQTTCGQRQTGRHGLMPQLRGILRHAQHCSMRYPRTNLQEQALAAFSSRFNFQQGARSTDGISRPSDAFVCSSYVVCSRSQSNCKPVDRQLCEGPRKRS